MTQPLEGIILSPEEGGALVAVQPARPALDLFITPTLPEAILAAVRAEALRDFTPDPTTPKGREAIKAQAFRVTKTKTYLEEIGKAEAAKVKELPKKLDAGRKVLKDGLEALAEEIRKPVTDWEAKREAWKTSLGRIQNLPATLFQATAAEIQENMQKLEAMPVDAAHWEEYAGEAASMQALTLASLRDLLEKRQKWEADQAELKRLREEKEERDRKDREEQLRKEGEERAKAALANPPAPIEAAPLPLETADALRRGETVPAVLPQAPAPAAAQPAALETLKGDVEHRRAFNREALADIVAAIRRANPNGEGLEVMGTEILKAIVTGQVRHIAITY